MKKLAKSLLLFISANFQLIISRFAFARFSKIVPLVEADFIKVNNTCVVIGNGPSLKEDINDILKLEKVDFFCVNHMAESDYFTILRPNKYALLDSYFWSHDADEKLKQKRMALFEALNKKVDWEINIYVPRNADLDYLKRNVINDNVKLIRLQVIPVHDINYSKLPYILLQGVYSPPPCNVLIYAIYLAIIAGYQRIDLYGADLSFTEDVVVDQNSNQLLIEYKHFYGQSTFEPLYKNPERVTPFTMESLYKTTYLTFFSHNLLNEMALIRGIKVTNKSSYSLIDSYERS